MRLIELPPLLAAIFNIALALFVFLKDPKARLNLVYLLWGASLATWNMGAFMMFRVQDAETALFWARVLHFGVIFIPPTVLHLSLLLAGIPIRSWIMIPYVGALILSGTNFSDLFIQDVATTAYAWFAMPGPAYYIYGAVFPLHTIPALVVLIRRRQTSQPFDRRRLNNLILANIGLLIFGIHDLLPIYGYGKYPFTDIPVFPWGTLMAAVYGLLVAYSVLQDQLLDVRVTLGRQAALLVRLFFLIGISVALLLGALVLNPAAFTPYAFFSACVVISIAAIMTGRFFPKLLGMGGEMLERRILGDRFEHIEQVEDFIRQMPYLTDLNRLLGRLTEILATSFAYDRFQLVAWGSRSELMDVNRSFPEGTSICGPQLTEEIVSFFRENPCEPVEVRELLARLPGIHTVSAEDWAFCFPMRGSNNKPLGFLIVARRDAVVRGSDIALTERVASNLGVVLDNIRLRTYSDEMESWEAVTAMSRGLAHDMRNLLTPIRVYMEIVRDEEVPEQQWPLLRSARSNTLRLISYVDDALFMHREQSPHLSWCNAQDVFDEVRESGFDTRKHDGIELITESEGKLIFNADRNLVVRLLSNLVGNAIDACEGRGRIELRATKRTRQGGDCSYVRFTVRDNGAGIPVEIQDKIFTPLFTTKDVGDDRRGFGLGLFICHRIAFLHEGVIDFKSTPGVGTTMVVELPIEGPPQGDGKDDNEHE